MLNTILRTAKTARQALQTAGLTLAIFSLPLLMAGGVGIHKMSAEMSGTQLLGTGNDDPVVYMADVQAALSRSEVDAPSTDADNGKPAPKKVAEAGDGQRGMKVAGAAPKGKRYRRAQADNPGQRVVPDMGNKQRMAASRSRARGTATCADPNPNIHHSGGESYRVRRSVIQHYTRNINAAMGLAAVAWHKDGRGKKDGFAVGRIRCGTPLAQFGIHNGDVIHAINGKRVKSIPAALGAVRRVARNDLIELEITRGGRRIRKTVRVI